MSHQTLSHVFTLSALAAAALLAACGGGQQSPDDAAASTAPMQAGASATAAAADTGICFYEHINYQGQSYCTSASTAWIGAQWNDRISSVRVPAGYKVELFQHANYGGRVLALTGDTANLVGLGFNDLASSLKITPPATSSKVATIQIAQSLLFNSDDSALVLVSGKAALVKVNVTSTDPNAPKPSGTLRVENTSTGEVRDLLLKPPVGALPTTVPEVPSFNDSYTATLPADVVKAGLKLTVRVGSAPATTLTPRVGGGVPMKFVPIAVQIAGVAGKLPADQGAHVQALFPVSSVTVQSHPAYVSTRVTSLPTTDAGWSDAFGKVLGELADLHELEGAGAHEHYFGFIPKRTWGLAGLAYVPGTAGVGFDMPTAPDTVRDVVAHELGHNFSLPHAACGGAGSPDPNYPYPNAQLGMPGRYVWPFLADTSSFYDPRPTDRHDIMSYCGGQVFSDYNYRKMQVFLTPTDKMTIASAADADAAAAPAQELILVSGEIHTGGSAELNPVKSLVGKPRLPEAGPYTLHIVTANGQVIDYRFAPRTLDHEATVRHFGFTIPNPGAIQSMTVLQDGKTIAQAKAASDGKARIQSAGAGEAAAQPQVQLQEAQGALKLTWDAARHAFLTVTWTNGAQRITLGQDLRGGSATLSSAELPAGGSYELILSDGLNSTRLQRTR